MNTRNGSSSSTPAAACQQQQSPLFDDTMTTTVYTRRDLRVLDLVHHQPMWIFDMTDQKMWYANRAALRDIWKADSLSELQSRDFGMTPATRERGEAYLERLRADHHCANVIHDLFTCHPRGEPVSVQATFSGIYVREDDDNDDAPPRFCLLNQVQSIVVPNTDIQESVLRGRELLRNLPVAVSQFDAHGWCMEQNPASVQLFGEISTSTTTTDDSLSFLRNRFVDPQQLDEIWHQVMDCGHDYCGELQQRTAPQQDDHQNHIRWFAVQLRRTRDPVHGEWVILYSARDIHPQVQAQHRALTAARAEERARQANRAKSEFVAVMAHEMRTPLHHVLGFLELLRNNNNNNKQVSLEQQEHYLDLAERSALALLGVVNDLLDFSKLEMGQMAMESVEFNVRTVAESCLQVLQTEARKQGIASLTLQMDDDDDNPNNNTFMGDPHRLRQILLNLLGNAVKFTPAGGSVALTIEGISSSTQDHRTLRFAVRDTGIGIHPDHVNTIFQQYQQASSAIALQYGGTGLGLAICQKIVDALGGRIGVDSQLGRGSCFWFELDYTVAAVTANENGSSSCNNKTEAPAPDEPPDARSLHILVAEDNKINQKLMASILKRLGHTMTLAPNGKLAVEAVQKQRGGAESGDDDEADDDDDHEIAAAESLSTPLSSTPPPAHDETTLHDAATTTQAAFDVVLMDVQMPLMDGLEATQAIRRLGCDNLPIVGLTAEYNSKNKDKFLVAGMNDCLGKPVRIMDLDSKLREWSLAGDR